MVSHPDALRTALRHHQAGELSAAEQIYRAVLASDPNHPEALHGLGLIASQNGRHDAAIELFHLAIQRNDNEAAYYNNLGNALLALKRLPEAVTAYRQAIILNPNAADAHSNLGNVLKDQGQLDEAIASYRRALELKPNLAEAHNNLGFALHEQGTLDEAVANLRRAIEQKPDYVDAYTNLGNVLQDQGKLDEAVTCYRQGLQLNPDHVEGLSNLGNVLWQQGKLEEAITGLQRSLKLRPTYTDAHNNLGNVFKEQGKLEEAIDCYRRAVDSKQDAVSAYSNLLFTIQYCEGVSLASLFEAHAEFDRRYGVPLRGTFAPRPASDVHRGRLRVGFVSPDLYRHPVAYFFIRILENLRSEQVDLICYHDRNKNDDLTQNLKAAATEWHEVFSLSDERLAERIHNDQIDILFDMAGHTGHNRLLMFARKPAPIQITWLGYVGTTGLQAMDYILADRHLIPPEAEPFYCEKVLRMPDDYACYNEPDDVPEPVSLPALKRGYVTFGSLNNLSKITPQVVQVWARILRRVPRSRLVIRYRGLNDASTRGRYVDLFAQEGIGVDRLNLIGWCPPATRMHLYHEIDLGLDPFPYSGATTTCDALWMGVPVVSCPRETFASRQSLTHLKTVGMIETIASNLDEYVEIAVGLANDLPRLAGLREGLRERMAKSPLCDGKRFAANLMSILRDVWDRHCQTNDGNPRPAIPSVDVARAVHHHQAGQLPEAEQIYRQILAADLNHDVALHGLGLIVRQAGHLDDAIDLYRRAIRQNETDASYHNDLGGALLALKRLPEAIVSYRRALELKPDFADAHNNLGNALREQGQLDEAVTSFRQAVQFSPEFVEAQNNLGNALCERGQLDDAVAAYRRALELKPDFVGTYSNLSIVLQTQGKFEEATAACRRGVELNPDSPELHCHLGRSLQMQTKLDEAVSSYRRALDLKPNSIDVLSNVQCNLGTALRDQGKLDEAILCYTRAIELKPDSADAHNNLGTALQAQGKLEDAIASLSRAIELKPESAGPYSNLGNAFKDMGRLDDAIACYRQAIKLNPDFVVANSNLLFTLQYCEGVSLASLFEAHATFGRQYGTSLRETFAPRKPIEQRNGRLRLGFVSPDWGRHPVGFFLVGVLEHLRNSQVDLIIYSDRLAKDDYTQRIQRTATEWHDVNSISDERLAEQIRNDRIDILFDLAGHTAKNRLLVFARRPAPIQITWAGYVGTTGLEAMDYILADRHEIPVGADQYYQEKVLRLPDGYICYEPPAYAPPVASLPALNTGHVTFGCFNNPTKITSLTIKYWIEILKRVPNSRLVLISKVWTDAGIVRRFTEKFAGEIDPSRLEFRSQASHLDLLAEYNHIDIALDPFPYSGGLTTCESLWMGVPVITCPGETFASRHSLSHLSNVGMTETIAHTLDEYVEIAVKLARDLPRLASLRTGLRERMARSPLCDGKRFATNLLLMLCEVWDRYCQANSQNSTSVMPVNKSAIADQLYHNGQLAAAEQLYRQVLDSESSHPEALHGLGVIANQAGQYESAVDLFGRAIQQSPNNAAYYNNLGGALVALKRLPDAIAAYRSALELNPEFVEAHNNLGNVLCERGQFEEAVASYRRALALKPDLAGAYRNLGITLQSQSKFDDAIASFQQASVLEPENAEAYLLLGSAFKKQGRLEEAIACYRQALIAVPDCVLAYSCLLYTLQFCEEVSPASLFDAHFEFDRRYGTSLRGTFASRPPVEQRNHRLRLGFVSPDWGRHPVGFFLVGVLEHLRDQPVDLVIYSDRIVKDDYTERIQRAATEWYDVNGTSDECLAEKIYNDRIDILFDLAGHTANNRLMVFARKPAPIQVTWAGYVGTTGLEAMDYILADRHEIPLGADQYYREEVLRLPDGYICYEPPAYAPPVASLPALKCGHVTFGCFNNLTKITPLTIQYWIEILKRVPNSRLVLKSKRWTDAGIVRRFTEKFAGEIDPSRLEFGSQASHLDLLAEYNRIDIALDPFPYSGGLTTCESLWMGVPVITCPGETFASRHSLSHLSNVGMTETIAHTLDEYVEIAVALAVDLPRLASLRAGLRERMARSPLCDGKRFATNLLSILHQVWDRHCQASGGISIPAMPVNAFAIAAQLHQTGQLAAAEQIYRQVLDSEPSHPEALHRLGVIANQARQYEAAVGLFRRAIQSKPGDVECHAHLGGALLALKRLPDAVAAYQFVLEREPENAEIHNCLGIALRQLRRLEEAAAHFWQAVTLNPQFAEPQCNLGNVLKDLGRLDDAVAAYDRALVLKPVFAGAHCNRGTALSQLGKLEEAVNSYRRAIELQPDFADAHNNLGAAFHTQWKLEDAVACYRRALQLQPDFADAHSNLGSALWDQHKIQDAIASYRRALQLKPDYAEPHAHLGLALLQMGNLDSGWTEYEWRIKVDSFKLNQHHSFSQPEWDGSFLAGRRILLLAEQGLGDTLQFVRYCQLVKARGGYVIVACQPPLMELLKDVEGIDELVCRPHGEDSGLPPFDVYLYMMSLPKVFNTTLETIPNRVPYLRADPQLVEQWREELGRSGELKIGIAWQGSRNAIDRGRSIPLAEFEPLGQIPGVRLISLQKGDGSEQVQQLAGRLSVTDYTARMDESTGPFLDTAALMMNLDLVITSDTSIAHLAGTLGVPVWVALKRYPDWRWLLDRVDSPWYPTMRLFRQESSGDWLGVFRRIATELRRFCVTKKSRKQEMKTDLQSKSSAQKSLLVETSVGELVDKITILEIKTVRIDDARKLVNVRRELEVLQASFESVVGSKGANTSRRAVLDGLITQLKLVNETLWQIEDDIRDCERSNDFGPTFVELARSVYRQNDRRAALKRQINELLGSRIVEEKSYRDYEQIST